MKPHDEENFLIEITPELHDLIKQELGDAYIDSYEVHYSPYWKVMSQDGSQVDKP